MTSSAQNQRQTQAEKEIAATCDSLFSACLAYTLTGEPCLLERIQLYAAMLQEAGYSPRYFEKKRALILDSVSFENAIRKVRQEDEYRDELNNPQHLPS